jgi:hypothetical protein
MKVSKDTESGSKRGFFLLTNSPPPADALEHILVDDIRPGWNVKSVTYSVGQTYSIELFAPSSASTYREVNEPKQEGNETIEYNLVIHNMGNGLDKVTLSSPGWKEEEDISLNFPENFTIPPGATDFINVSILIEYPVPLGIYEIKVLAHSMGEEDESDNLVTLTLSIGRAPVSSGIYLLNGSLDVRPKELVIGREAKVFFTARSFGFLDRNGFNVNLLLNGKLIRTVWFDITQYSDRDCEISLMMDRPTIDTSGTYVLNISLSDGRDPGPGITDLVTAMSTEIIVGFIDLNITSVTLMDGDDELSERKIRPGDLDISVLIRNHGDITANLAIVSLTIVDLDQGERRNLTLNLTELNANATRELIFKNIDLESERDYEILVTVDGLERWRDTDPDNDLSRVDVRVGSIPPEVPLWRDPLWAAIGFIIILLVTMVLLFYLLKKKL